MSNWMGGDTGHESPSCWLFILVQCEFNLKLKTKNYVCITPVGKHLNDGFINNLYQSMQLNFQLFCDGVNLYKLDL